MLKIPVIWIMIFAVVIYTTSFCFFTPTFADHVKNFTSSETVVGLLLLLCQGAYTASAPVIGIVIDRWQCSNTILVFGSTSTIISMLLIGPSPLFNLEKSLLLICLSLVILGVAAAALYIPTYKNCLDASK